MTPLVFATGNARKIAEVEAMLGGALSLLGLRDIDCWEELPETSATIAANALQKARYVYERYGHDCFAEDTGLEVDALGGAPGVLSARYAGEARDEQANVRLLLSELEGHSDRSARFRTVIALILDGEEHLFEGVAEGRIVEAPRGEGGFGYDPVFAPEGEQRTFAEMSPGEKNASSHRARALRGLLVFLRDRLASQGGEPPRENA
jgi:XTP/dITP diphosphohydrolase